VGINIERDMAKTMGQVEGRALRRELTLTLDMGVLVTRGVWMKGLARGSERG
jgi:hypothetical protein